MAIVVGLDVHREQSTLDELETETGELRRGRSSRATREPLRARLSRYRGKRAGAALEATTGCLFVIEELERARVHAHLADPAEVRARRARKRRAKTDRLDARTLRELLQQGQLAPAAWIPPAHLQELRTLVRLRKTLVAERRAWQQRIQATLFHHGFPREPSPRPAQGRRRLQALPLPAAARMRVEAALPMLEHLHTELAPLAAELRASARPQPGCRAVTAQFGIGALSAPLILAELGDVRRFGASRRALRESGLEVTVCASDQRRPPGKLSRQGPPLLRWALYECAKCARYPSSPAHEYWRQALARLGRKRAPISVSRRLLRRCHHTLLRLGEEALAPAA